MAEAVPTEINKFVGDINLAILKFKGSLLEPNKNELFQKLFELMTFKCGEIWGVVLHSTRYTQTVVGMKLTTTIESLLEQLESIFYSKSKWLKMDDSKDFDDKNEPIKELARLVKESYRIEPIPSKLFLEFLLFVATQIRDTLREDTAKLACLGQLVRLSDQESVLNNAQEKDRFFNITTEPTTKDVYDQILQIYEECGITFTGNISISHIIGQLCEGNTGGTNVETELSQSQSSDEPLNVRSGIEQMMLNRYSLTKADDVQKSPPRVKGGITKPISSIRTPNQSVLYNRTKALPDATIKQPAAVQHKPTCKYGVNCYRKDIQHKLDFYHPDKPDKPQWRPGGGSGKSKRTRHRSSSKRRHLSSKRTTRRTRRCRC
jgi:hypothetical protein